MTYAVMRLNEYSHIEDTYTCVFSSKDRYDRERELSSELARAFTGITENPIDVPLGLRFKGYEISERNRWN